MPEDVDSTTRAFLADTEISEFMTTPWTSFIPKSELDPQRELFCVATWGRVSLFAAPQFAIAAGKVKSQIAALPPGSVIGAAYSVSAASLLTFQAETLTVWRSREDMWAFFGDGAHREAMDRLRGKVEFRAHKVWVKPVDLPHNGGTSTAFWSAVKRGSFREERESERPARAAEC